MSLIAYIQTDVSGNIIIQMRGSLDYEINTPLKNEIKTILMKYPTSDVTLDFQNVEFVGSSGISIFVENVNTLNKEHEQRLKISNVRPEFYKIFKLYHLNDIGTIIEFQEKGRSQNNKENVLNTISFNSRDEQGLNES